MPPFRIGRLELDPSTLQAAAGELTKTLEPRVMQALVALCEADRAVISRDRLVDLCWGGRAISEDAINRCISKARRLGTELNAFKIETIRRVGYRLVPSEHLATTDSQRPRLPFQTKVFSLTLLLVAFGAGTVSGSTVENAPACRSVAFN